MRIYLLVGAWFFLLNKYTFNIQNIHVKSIFSFKEWNFQIKIMKLSYKKKKIVNNDLRK